MTRLKNVLVLALAFFCAACTPSDMEIDVEQGLVRFEGVAGPGEVLVPHFERHVETGSDELFLCDVDNSSHRVFMSPLAFEHFFKNSYVLAD